MHILILSIAGAGKTTLANKLGKKTGKRVVSFDSCRYGEGWVRRSYNDFRNLVFDKLACNHSDGPKGAILESTYYEEDGFRIQLIRELLARDLISTIYIIRPPSLEIITGQLIDRCIERVLLAEKGLPTVHETSQNRAQLLIKNITLYDISVETLRKTFGEKSATLCFPQIIIESRDDLTELLGLPK